MIQHSSYILSKLKSGDSEAFTLIFNEYFPKVKIFLSKVMGGDQYSEEFAQEVFVRLWINHSKISTDQPITSYLFTISKNIAMDYYRKRSSEIKYIKHIEHCGDKEIKDCDSELTYNQLSSIIEQAVENMPQKQRVVFKLSREDGLINQEIADKLKLSRRTVEKHITNAIKIIRKNLNVIG
ncbi:MAG: RNA polymerase sigma-70 factor [Rikenellaceae bacterium]